MVIIAQDYIVGWHRVYPLKPQMIILNGQTVGGLTVNCGIYDTIILQAGIVYILFKNIVIDQTVTQ